MPFRFRAEDLSFVDRAPVVVRAETRVAASPAVVWPAFADAAAWPKWFGGMQDARYTSPAPHGVGSTRSVRVMGLVADETILAFDPEKCFAFRVDAANAPAFDALVEVVTFEPAAGGTRVVYRQAFGPKPWLRWLLPLLRGRMQAGLQRGLDGLGPYLERGRP